MIQNFDPTLYALYFDSAGGYTSRPVLAIDDDDIAYVAASDGSLIPADEYADLARIESVEFI